MQKIHNWWRDWLLLGLSSCCLLLGGSLIPAQAATKPVTVTPTFFFHGSGSSYRAEVHMVGAAKHAHVTKSVIRADVSAHGKVKLIGKWHPKSPHPIVEVNYLGSNNTNNQTWGRWARNAVRATQQRYHFKQMYMVGHSMGNMAIMYYLLANGRNQKLPKLLKQVALGGHFDGVFGEDDYPHYLRLNKNGRPNHLNGNYRQLLRLRQTYPWKQVSVLNIYGDLHNGTDSDGRVSNASSRSLRYLLANRALHYRSKQVTGWRAQHSKLHNNPQVDKLLIKFLWPQV